MRALLDTHIWVWWLTGDAALTSRERTALDRLPGRFHGDPADRLIVATATTHRLPLATGDLRIRASRTVPLWKP